MDLLFILLLLSVQIIFKQNLRDNKAYNYEGSANPGPFCMRTHFNIKMPFF